MAIKLARTIGICAGMYLLAAFTAWDFNAGNWDGVGRYFLACLALVASAFVWTME